jgi:hypothetical protein
MRICSVNLLSCYDWQCSKDFCQDAWGATSVKSKLKQAIQFNATELNKNLSPQRINKENLDA